MNWNRRSLHRRQPGEVFLNDESLKKGKDTVQNLCRNKDVVDDDLFLINVILSVSVTVIFV